MATSMQQNIAATLSSRPEPSLLRKVAGHKLNKNFKKSFGGKKATSCTGLEMVICSSHSQTGTLSLTLVFEEYNNCVRDYQQKKASSQEQFTQIWSLFVNFGINIGKKKR